MGGSSTAQRVVLGTAVALLAVAGSACYPGSISDIGEADLVFTAFDPEFAFTTGTFVLPDSIVRAGDGDEDDINREFDDQILDEVADQLIALGYTRIDETSPTPPDFVFFVGANSSTFNWWVPGGWWGWWGWYPGWGDWYPGWGPGYGPGYSWYPGFRGSYATGSLFIGMIDVGRPAVGTELAAVWGGVINGLLSGRDETTAARALDLIDQVFEQSPYLGG